MAEIITRANTVTLAFTFLDNTGAAATATSATVQLDYPGKDQRQTETLTLTDPNEDGIWTATWDSSKSRKGWVHYHAHAISDAGDELTQDGRFKLSANRANYQHDRLPSTNPTDYDYSVGD